MRNTQNNHLIAVINLNRNINDKKRKEKRIFTVPQTTIKISSFESEPLIEKLIILLCTSLFTSMSLQHLTCRHMQQSLGW
jgi:hypothetical protein